MLSADTKGWGFRCKQHLVNIDPSLGRIRISFSFFFLSSDIGSKCLSFFNIYFSSCINKLKKFLHDKRFTWAWLFWLYAIESFDLCQSDQCSGIPHYSLDVLKGYNKPSVYVDISTVTLASLSCISHPGGVLRNSQCCLPKGFKDLGHH